MSWEDTPEAWGVYQTALDEATNGKTVRNGDNRNELNTLLGGARSTWSLWGAENDLRWIVLRDSALGLGALSAGLGGVGALVVARTVRRRTTAEHLPRLSRMLVTPNQPLDFSVPQADPRSTALYAQAEKLGVLSPLTEQILACFAASPEHPASLADHLNVPGGLIEHTARTIEIMATLAQGRPDDERRLCLLMALGHDLGKVLAYENSDGGWIDRRLPHDRISGLMIASLPALYSEMGPAHREALLCALRYYHNPEEIPTSAPPVTSVLFELMHKADAIAHEQETSRSRQQVEGVKPYLWEAFCAAVPDFNINRHRGGYPEGFTAEDLVYVLEHALREKTLDRLPSQLKEKLPIRRPLGKLHPAWPLLVDVLREHGVLAEAAQGRKPNPSALFNINASGVTYKCVAALSLPALEALAPEAVRSWTRCQPYEVKLTGARHA
ncbi:MAG: HD domain-containing protein [Nitrospirota bacterium]